MTQFQKLIKIIQEDLVAGEQGYGLEGVFVKMYDNDINTVLTKIRGNFGLLTIEAWWSLVFRTHDGRAAVIFIDLLKGNLQSYANMNFEELFRFIIRSDRWRQLVTGEPGPENGMGPWIPPGGTQ